MATQATEPNANPTLPDSGQGAKELITNWWAGVGAWTRLIPIITLVIWLLSLFIRPTDPLKIIEYGAFGGYFAATYASFTHLFIWTIFTSPFVNFSSGIWVVILYMVYSAEIEKKRGTVLYFVDWWILWFQTFLVWLVLIVLWANIINPFYAWFPIFGILPVCEAFLTQECVRDPNAKRTFCGKEIPIPNIAYPIILIGWQILYGFVVYSGFVIPLDLIAGFIVGALNAQAFMPKYNMPRESVTDHEGKTFVGWLRENMNFINIEKATDPAPAPGLEIHQTPAQSNATPFAGAGQPVGADANPGIPVQPQPQAGMTFT